MLEAFSSNPKITEYLHLYPKSQWEECLVSIVIIGISALENSFKRFLPLEELVYLSESIPLPLSFQIPELKQTLAGMKETIDMMNLSLEKENEELRKTSRKSSTTKRTQKTKKTVPNPILVESTPRFKVLDDAFTKQKWKRESPMPIIREDSKSPLLKPSTKPKLSQKPLLGDKKFLKISDIKPRIDVRPPKIPADGNFTERACAGSPTLEELLSNSRFTIRDDGKTCKNEESSDSKQSLESSAVKRDASKRTILIGQQKCAVTIAEGFLKNPLISQLAPKDPFKKSARNSDYNEDETNSKISIRSYSPINSMMLLKDDDL